MSSPTSASTSYDGIALPRSARLAWWLTAWLRGHVVTDLALQAVADDDGLHLVASDDGEGQLLDLFARARRAGATYAGLALPVEGDLLGLGGPRELNDAAQEAGEAVVLPEAGLGAVPEEQGEVVRWHVLEGHRRQLPDVGDADRGLRQALLATAESLAALDVARWRPEAADLLMNLHHPAHLDAPPGTPARCVDLAARGLRASEVVDVALLDEGGAVSATEVRARREALQPLERAARRALVAACSPEGWPDH
jgi:hypothetical protein